MNISENWLREWIDIECDTEQLAEQLTMAGLEVEAINPSLPQFSGVIVGKIDHVENHSETNALRLCHVSIGDQKDLVPVVSAATNVDTGLYVALAPINAILAKNIKVQAVDFKGVKSEGVLCSAAELGLTDISDGVLELADNLTLGMELVDALNLNDQTITLSLTPNRGDCLSILGVARELSAINRCPIRFPLAPSTELNETINTHAKQKTRNVVVQQSTTCPRYIGRIIEGVNLSRPSPLWLSERLRHCGVKSINTVVDVTNYLMLEIGQPMHAYDDDKLQGDIIVRYAYANEKLQLLDGQECTLSTDTLVIADSKVALGIAGVIGGFQSSVTHTTNNIFLESAFFTPHTILGKARQYGLHTESAHRFERGVDFKLQKNAIVRATQMIIDICGGKAHPIIENVLVTHLPQTKQIELRDKQIHRVLGINLANEEVVAILSSLGMQVEPIVAGWMVSPPSFRFDINIEVDLIEEIARIYSYNNITTQLPKSYLQLNKQNTHQNISKRVRELMVYRNFHEVITYSFVDPKLLEILNFNTGALQLVNPIAPELSAMRTSLLPGLVSVALYNQNRQQQRIRLFEIGQVFNMDQQLNQPTLIASIILGNVNKRQWAIEDKESDFFDLKQDVKALCELSAVTNLEFKHIEHPILHLGKSAEIIADGQHLGFIGALHPSLEDILGLKKEAFIFELNLNNILEKNQLKYQKISKFPSINRDISITVPNDIPATDITDWITKIAGELLYSVELFDVYQGKTIDLDRKSLSFSLIFWRNSSTLQDQSVEVVTEVILASLEKRFNALLRE